MTGAADDKADLAPTQQLFLEQWQVYRKMVDNDYLFHRGAYDCLHRYLKDEVAAPFRFLEAACGDASMSTQALMGTKVSDYAGIDISHQALDIARTNLALLSCPVTLEERDFVSALREWQRPADIVWIGLSLHHLLAPGKTETLGDIRRIVGDRGRALVYENASPDGESRAQWLTRWDAQESLWTAYTPREWQMVNDHVHASDFPETDETWQRIGHAAGFARVRSLYRSPTDLFRLYAFEPSH
jgi:ubiquinone/menaquinone biosynthesis C-methylase UbiE